MYALLRRFLLLPNPYDHGVNDYWRLRLNNVYLLLTLFVFSFFAVFNLLVTGLYANAIADLIGLVLVLYTLWDYHRRKSVERTSALVLFNIYLISLGIIMVAEKDYGILFWSIFAPIFSVFLLGRKRGLFASLFYYAVLVAHLVSQLGEGVSAHLFLEFVIVSAILLAVVYYYELNRSEAYALIQKASVEDPLTGLYNRRWFGRLFDSEYRRARRERRPFIFFIMDVDNFKRYNDSNGHDKGDEVLKRIAEVLSGEMRRSGDEVFRLGGEEFGGIIGSGDESDPDAFVDRLRARIEAMDIALEPGSDERLTASFGLSITPPDVIVPHSLIYRNTDQALYCAKENGRNRVEVVQIAEE